jgi:hypothetical protein
MSDIEHRRAKVEPLWAVTHKVGEGQGDPDQTVRDERPEAKLARLEAQLAGAVGEIERLRAENEKLLALENGDWRARYSDASREIERLRDQLGGR